MTNQKLSRWFGLSYASYLTLPRVFMESMPDEWQEKMAELLNEYDSVYVNQPDMSCRVQITNLQGKLIKTPKWLINYRRPDLEMIATCKTHAIKDCPGCDTKNTGGFFCNKCIPFN